VPGHVSTGRLQKIRGEIFDVDGRRFNEGNLVTFLDVHRTCNACWYCLVAKAGTRCPQRKVYGITYGLDDGLCGGWASHIYIKPGTRCIRLDADPKAFEPLRKPINDRAATFRQLMIDCEPKQSEHDNRLAVLANT